MNKQEEYRKILCRHLEHGVEIARLDINNQFKRIDGKLTISSFNDVVRYKNLVPILYDLDLTKPIKHDGREFVPMEELYIMFGAGYSTYNSFKKSGLNDYSIPRLLTYQVHQLFLSWHLNVFELKETEYINKHTI